MATWALLPRRRILGDLLQVLITVVGWRQRQLRRRASAFLGRWRLADLPPSLLHDPRRAPVHRAADVLPAAAAEARHQASQLLVVARGEGAVVDVAGEVVAPAVAAGPGGPPARRHPARHAVPVPEAVLLGQPPQARVLLRRPRARQSQADHDARRPPRAGGGARGFLHLHEGREDDRRIYVAGSARTKSLALLQDPGFEWTDRLIDGGMGFACLPAAGKGICICIFISLIRSSILD